MEITHRQMRNESGEVLRRVAAGESIVVTNHGQPAAVISPVSVDVLAALTAQGAVRVATSPLSELSELRPRRSTKTGSEILADTRGRW